MHILLYSQSGSDTDLKTFKDFFQIDPKGQRVVLVSNGYDEVIEDATEYKKNISVKKEVLGSFGFHVTTVDLRVHTKRSLQTILDDSDILWVRGGTVGTLVKAFQESGLATILKDALLDGLMYVGSSAGAMVLSDYLDIAAHYPGEEESQLENVKGLGIIDFQMIPHANAIDLSVFESVLESDRTYYTLPDGAAIGVDDGQIEFYGEGITQVY